MTTKQFKAYKVTIMQDENDQYFISYKYWLSSEINFLKEGGIFSSRKLFTDLEEAKKEAKKLDRKLNPIEILEI